MCPEPALFRNPERSIILINHYPATPGLVGDMCFFKIEKPDHDEEVALPNRLYTSSQPSNGHDLSLLPPRLRQPHLRPRALELRRSVSQDRIVLVETIEPRSSGLDFRQSLYKAESKCQLGPRLVLPKDSH